MGKWFPKTQLTWREPQAIARQRMDEDLKKWSTRSRVLFVLLVPFVILPPWLISWELDRTKAQPPEIAVPAAFALGIILVYGLPQLQRLFPSYVRIMDHGIARSSHGTAWWTYDRIESCSFELLEIDGQQVSVLTITPKQGNEIRVGIDPLISRERLSELLNKNGVRIAARNKEPPRRDTERTQGADP